MMLITDILSSDAVVAPLRVKSKKRLLQEISNFAAQKLNLNESIVQSVLLERETLGPTGVGNGVAIPHGRVSELDRVHGFFFRLDAPIDFESVDRKPIDLVFMLLAPEQAGADHLKALAKVSRLLREENVRAKLRSTDDPQALFAIITAEEASQAA